MRISGFIWLRNIVEKIEAKHRVSLDEVEQIVKRDEAITMTVLRYANSAHYGRPGRVFIVSYQRLTFGKSAIFWPWRSWGTIQGQQAMSAME